ncbi:MAG: hypothetical protein LBM64_10165 [Deltaproteobacteria bacterium]|jgi:hypothetical protein|nr:hypothetical protein [Deltaproteobacteria bacterium]
MSKKKDVNIHYLRVVTIPENVDFSLQNMAITAHRQLCNLEERTIDRGDKRYSCLRCEEHQEGLLLNVSVCTPDEPANTIPKPNTQSVVEPSLIVAPENADFMDGDVHALLWDRHVLICSVRSRPTLLKAYLDAIFSGIEVDIPEFFLAPAAPAQALRALSEGIKKIDISAAAYAAQLSQINDAQKGFFANLGLATIGTEKPLATALEQKDTHAKVMVSVQQSGKINQNSETQRELAKIAQNLIESTAYTPYCITTKKNSRITPEILQRKAQIRLEPFGKTVFRSDAWAALIRQKTEWQSEGLFSGSN